MVGAVRMDIPRDDFFRKEISVVISRSYGPGRYDPNYEEGGNDYPASYVRFTEQRNMQTVVDLIAGGMLDVKGLITHRFKVDDAVAAYALIEGRKKEPYLGIVLGYDAAGGLKLPVAKRIDVAVEPINKSRLGVSMGGAGNYATASLLPPLRDNQNIELRGLMTASGRTAASVAKQFGFRFCASDICDLLGADTDAVVIATRHNTHADFVCNAVTAGKHVFVEKPLALTMDELARVASALDAAPSRQLQVGFNRRYAPLTREVIKHFEVVTSPRVVAIRVNAGFIPAEHWIQNPEMGGGRLIGEACHFLDLACALVDADPIEVFAIGTTKSGVTHLLNDNLVISLRFSDGSVASVVYTADGSKAQAKERIEVFGGGRSAVIDDFRNAEFYDGDTGARTKRGRVQDKGQKAMILGWIESIRSGQPQTLARSILAVSAAAVGAVESMTIGTPVQINEAAWSYRPT